MRRTLFLAILLLVLSISRSSLAATNGTDFSDLWWNPAESGWGATFTQQRNVLFVTLFVYAQDGSAKWYSAATFRDGLDWSGDLYEGRGPWFGSTFNPGLVVNRKVGTMLLNMPFVNSGTMTYNVDGVNVVKAIQRQSFRAGDLSGNYIGGFVTDVTGCGASNGRVESPVNFLVNDFGSSATIAVTTSTGARCNYTGTKSQAGRMGQIDGTFTCPQGPSGTFVAFEIESGTSGFLARYEATYGSCREVGHLGGVKR